MKRGIFIVFLLFTTCLIITGQVDYKSKGMSYAANGNYVDAQSQFEAAKAVLQSKKVSQNAPEFIDIEKKISYAKQCLAFSKQATQALSKLTDAALQNAYTECNTESDADQVQESLLATLEKAKNALSNIRSKFSTDKVATANLARCAEIESKINGFRANFTEVLAWKNALAINTISAFEEFLSTYPNGNYSGTAKTKISEFKEVLAWADASNADNYDSYANYLKQFPKGLHSEEAKHIVNQMGDEMCWSSDNEIGTTESYKDYISRYPSGKYITYAKQRLAKCQERDYWEAQYAINTVSAYKSYLSKYPKGSYVAAAQNGIDKIGEASVWAKAEQENTIEGYQAYLNASKKKAFKKEAEERIAQIKHEQEIREDDSKWAKIANSMSSMDYLSYLTSPNYKGHTDEATARYNILIARGYPLNAEKAEDIISAYNTAMKYTTIDPGDKDKLNKAKEIVSFQNFSKNRSITSALSYLEDFPQGEYYQQVSDAVAMMKADQMDMNVTVSEYLDAIGYASSKNARTYVQNHYNQNQAAYKRYLRSLKTEPIHGLMAMDGVFYNMNDEIALDIAPVFSIGGRSNRLNLELGYYFRSGYAMVRPRLNLIKKNFQGELGATIRPDSQYSKFTLFVAPELVYFVKPITNEYSTPYDGYYPPETVYSSYDDLYYSDFEAESVPLEYYPRLDYGARAGIGIGVFDFFAGYRMVSQSFYVGITWNFSSN